MSFLAILPREVLWQTRIQGILEHRRLAQIKAARITEAAQPICRSRKANPPIRNGRNDCTAGAAAVAPPPFPGEVTLKMLGPSAYDRRGTCSASFPRCKQLRGKPNFPPNASGAPLNNRAGISLSAKNAMRFPRRPSVPVGAPAAIPISRIPPLPNVNFAFAGEAAAAGKPFRWWRTLWRINYLKRAKFAAAPVSRVTILSSPEGEKTRKPIYGDRQGAGARNAAFFRLRPRFRRGHNGFLEECMDWEVMRTHEPAARREPPPYSHELDGGNAAKGGARCHEGNADCFCPSAGRFYSTSLRPPIGPPLVSLVPLPQRLLGFAVRRRRFEICLPREGAHFPIRFLRHWNILPPTATRGIRSGESARLPPPILKLPRGQASPEDQSGRGREALWGHISAAKASGKVPPDCIRHSSCLRNKSNLTEYFSMAWVSRWKRKRRTSWLTACCQNIASNGIHLQYRGRRARFLPDRRPCARVPLPIRNQPKTPPSRHKTRRQWRAA